MAQVSPPAIARKTRRVFYGWWVVTASFFAQAIQSAIYGYGFGAFFLPIAREFGAGRAAVSGAFSFVRLESGLLGPFQGWIIERFGSRKTMTVGYIIFGAGMILVSRCRSLPEFYLTFAVTAIGANLSGFMPTSAAVINWFSKRRGLALSIALSGGSVGGVLLPLIAWSIMNHGWRTTAFACGIFIWAAGIPLARIIRYRPEEMGMLPDGAPAELPTASGVVTGPLQEESLTVRAALRSKSFWLLSSAHSISLLVGGTISTHQVPAMVDLGLSEPMAATMVGFTAALMIPGRLIGGLLGDRLGKKPVIIVAFFVQSAAMVVLAVGDGMSTAIAFSVLYGLGFAARAILITGLRGDFFGRRGYATISGLTEPILTIGTVIGPVLAGWAFDTYQSYRVAFLIIAAVNLVGAFLIAFAKNPLAKKSV